MEDVQQREKLLLHENDDTLVKYTIEVDKTVKGKS